MTDKEIIKALEICTFNNRSCGDCLYKPETEDEAICMDRLLKDALDLINRQQAEIERLKKCNEEWRQELIQDRKEYFANVKKYRDAIAEKNEKMFLEAEAQIRPEAIKEFAEKLEHKLADNGDMTMAMWLSVVTDMHDLVKEMVGADNEH